MITFLDYKLNIRERRQLQGKLDDMQGERVNIDYFEETIKYPYELSENEVLEILDRFEINLI